MDNIPLGKDTKYPKVFDPSLLFAIPRAQARENLSIFKGLTSSSPFPFYGFDEWTLYEICWRDQQGGIEMAVGVLRIPCNSPFIVESKSLKLYINSLYYHVFNSSDELVQQVSSDVSSCLGLKIEFCLYALDEVPSNLFINDAKSDGYKSLDHHHVDIRSINNNELSAASTALSFSGVGGATAYQYKTARFRSLCPVTGQPDWASIYITLIGVKVDEPSLAQYLVSFAEHQGFHENCVERIYTELQQQLLPEGIAVAARYTRRGGIDINPLRASSEQLLVMPCREIRQ